MAKAETKEVAVPPKNGAALPAHLQGGKKAKLGNLDKSDLIIPRVKLLQAISPEIVEQNNPLAKPGQFWHTIAAEPMGDRLTFVPIVIRKTLALWAPRGDQRGILARSSDCVNWDAGFKNQEFDVKPKGVARAFKINTGDSVKSSFIVDLEDSPSLDEFGTGIPGDPKSAPMASLTYNMLFYFPDFPDYSPAVVINTRSAVKAAKGLISKIEMRDVDHFAQKWIMITTDETGDEGPYKGYGFVSDGYVDEATYEITKALFGNFGDADWKPSEEGDDTGSSGGGKPQGDTNSSKF